MGLGVYATQFIRSSRIIEKCPIIKISRAVIIEKDDYSFNWDSDYFCFVTGYGSLYNHSYTPNAMYVPDFENNLFLFISIKDINENEEIFTNYNGNIYSQDELWFKVGENND